MCYLNSPFPPLHSYYYFSYTYSFILFLSLFLSLSLSPSLSHCFFFFLVTWAVFSWNVNKRIHTKPLFVLLTIHPIDHRSFEWNIICCVLHTFKTFSYILCLVLKLFEDKVFFFLNILIIAVYNFRNYIKILFSIKFIFLKYKKEWNTFGNIRLCWRLRMKKIFIVFIDIW